MEHRTLKDPVCGMTVTSKSFYHLQHQGQTHYFCGARCKQRFSAINLRGVADFVHTSGRAMASATASTREAGNSILEAGNSTREAGNSTRAETADTADAPGADAMQRWPKWQRLGMLLLAGLALLGVLLVLGR